MAKNGMDRRTFLKLGGILGAGAVIAPGTQAILSTATASSGDTDSVRWAMGVYVDRCGEDCKDDCERACREENNVPFYDEPRWDAYWLRVAEFKPHGPFGKTKYVPLMCMQCDDPPCVHVCVTKASFIRDDGIVHIDEHLCIGCRYCVIACPYRARSMVFKKTPDDQWYNRELPKMMIGVATKCTFCVHLVDDGEDPACVQKCPNNALVFGNLNDPESDVARMLQDENTQVLRPQLEVGPNVYYTGL